MMNNGQTANNENSAWIKLTQKFPDHPAFEDDTIYALPLRLIRAIEHRVPGLWDAADIEFEYALNKESGMGLFLKEPFWFQPFEKYFIEEKSEESKFAVGQKRIDESIKQLTREIMQEDGYSVATIDHYFVKQKQYEIRAQERRLGYAGWLITSPEFQMNRMAFWGKWKTAISTGRNMPRFPKLKMVDENSQIPVAEREYYGDYIRFYSKWSLDSFVTWDLPLPMFSNPVTYSQYNEDLLSEAGVSLFIPWYLLADKDLKLDEMVDHVSHFKEVKHLDLLLKKNTQDNEKLGPVRNFSMLQMYVFLFKGLFHRYSEKLHNNLGRIDQAFTEFQMKGECSDIEIASKVDNTKRIRNLLKKELEKIERLGKK